MLPSTLNIVEIFNEPYISVRLMAFYIGALPASIVLSVLAISYLVIFIFNKPVLTHERTLVSQL